MRTCIVTGCENESVRGWAVCEACQNARRDKIHQRRLERSITLDEAHDIERQHAENGYTWWRLVDDNDRQEPDLDTLVEQLLDNAWSYKEQQLDPEPLPDLLELVVGKRLSFDVLEALEELYEDYDQWEDLRFDANLVRAAQAVVDAAAASANMWGEGTTHYVDIRPIHAQAIARFLEER